MQRVAITFCLLALAAIQVPWIVCTGCCEDVVIPALGVHTCHVHEADEAHDHGHAHHEVCTCGHDGEDEPENGNPATDHLLVQLPALTAGTTVVLPDHVQTELTVGASTFLPHAAASALHFVHDPPEASPTVPRGASERLLL